MYDSAKNLINVIFRDKFGLITYRDGNGGDTCQMTAFYHYALYLNNQADIPQLILDLHPLYKSGILIRHPDRAKGWDQPGQRDIAKWNNPSNLSRDQLLPMCITLGALGITSALNPILRAVRKRWFRSQNGDPILFYHFSAIYIRATNTKFGYPILLLTDLVLVLNSIIDLIRARLNPKRCQGYKNALMCMSQAYECMPTPFSFLARRLYRLRPGGFFEGYKGAYSDWDDPPFPELFEDYIKKIF